MTVCSPPEDGLRCLQGIKPPLAQLINRPLSVYLAEIMWSLFKVMGVGWREWGWLCWGDWGVRVMTLQISSFHQSWRFPLGLSISDWRRYVGGGTVRGVRVCLSTYLSVCYFAERPALLRPTQQCNYCPLCCVGHGRGQAVVLWRAAGWPGRGGAQRRDEALSLPCHMLGTSRGKVNEELRCSGGGGGGSATEPNPLYWSCEPAPPRLPNVV